MSRRERQAMASANYDPNNQEEFLVDDAGNPLVVSFDNPAVVEGVSTPSSFATPIVLGADATRVQTPNVPRERMNLTEEESRGLYERTAADLYNEQVGAFENEVRDYIRVFEPDITDAELEEKVQMARSQASVDLPSEGRFEGRMPSYLYNRDAVGDRSGGMSTEDAAFKGRIIDFQDKYGYSPYDPNTGEAVLGLIDPIGTAYLSKEAYSEGRLPTEGEMSRPLPRDVIAASIAADVLTGGIGAGAKGGARVIKAADDVTDAILARAYKPSQVDVGGAAARRMSDEALYTPEYNQLSQRNQFLQREIVERQEALMRKYNTDSLDDAMTRAKAAGDYDYKALEDNMIEARGNAQQRARLVEDDNYLTGDGREARKRDFQREGYMRFDSRVQERAAQVAEEGRAEIRAMEAEEQASKLKALEDEYNTIMRDVKAKEAKHNYELGRTQGYSSERALAAGKEYTDALAEMRRVQNEIAALKKK